MVTTSITNQNFSRRAWSCLRSGDKASDPSASAGYAQGPSLPVLAPIAADETDLVPAEFNSRVIGFTDPFINICSPDPVVSDVSRQILHMEIAYAAFCGMSSIFVTGPALYTVDGATPGLAKFALAIEESLALGANLSISILFPMTDEPSNRRVTLQSSAAGPEAKRLMEAERARKSDTFGTWDAWNFIRTMCNYSSRLFAG